MATDARPAATGIKTGTISGERLAEQLRRYAGDLDRASGTLNHEGMIRRFVVTLRCAIDLIAVANRAGWLMLHPLTERALRGLSPRSAREPASADFFLDPHVRVFAGLAHRDCRARVIDPGGLGYFNNIDRSPDWTIDAIRSRLDSARDVLVELAKRVSSSPLRETLVAFDRFTAVLEATTIPTADGGRVVAGIAHAVTLSEETDAFHQQLSATERWLIHQFGQPEPALPPMIRMSESDSPDGPWSPVPDARIRASSAGIGERGADAAFLAAIESAARVTAFPADKWNALQASKPGANHQRWHAGDVLSAQDLAYLQSASNLLRLRMPAAHSLDESGHGPVRPPQTAAGSHAQVDGAKPEAEPSCTHADDFTWVVWFGVPHRFSKGNQSESVRILWEHWVRAGRRDGYGCSEKTIGERIGTSSDGFRLAPVFRGHPAWGELIRPTGQRGCFALFSPESPLAHTS